MVEWESVPLRFDDGKTQAKASGPLFAADRSNRATVVYTGTGEFVGRPAGKPRSPANGAENGITLNLVGVPIAQAAKVILGDILGVNFVVDPKVDGKVTVQTTRPLPKSALPGFFDAALRSVNATLIQGGDFIKIVPADAAAGAASTLRVGGTAPPGDTIGSGLQVVQLKFVSALDMKRILDPISPKGGVVRADDGRNALILSGSPQELATMLEAVRIFDIDTMRGMSIAMVPVRTSEPDAIAEDVRNIFGGDKEGPLSGLVRFLPNKRLGTIMVITSQPQYLTRAESWIRRLDTRAQGVEKQIFTYPVQNRPAKELVGVLNSMFGAEGSDTGRTGQVAPRARASTISTAGAQPAGGGAAQSPFGAITIAGAAPQPGQGAAGAGAGFSDSPPSGRAQSSGTDVTTAKLGDSSRLKISADDSNNAIVVYATPADYQQLLRVIQTLDIVPNQVLIEATIAEVSLNDDMQFGVRWYLQNKSTTRPQAASFIDNVAGSLAAAYPGFNYVFKAASAQVTISALNKVTDVNIISSPSLMVLDNKTATLQVGDQVPISTQTATNLVASNAIVNTVSYRDTGVILSITPRINESGRVLLDIEQEVSSVSTTTSSGIDSPTIQQRKIKTTVLVNNGEALTLGGLIQNKKSVSRDQVPILGDIPLIGNAFKSKGDVFTKTELIIIITPKVVRNLNEAQAVTDEYRVKLRAVTPRVGGAPRTFKENIRRILQ